MSTSSTRVPRQRAHEEGDEVQGGPVGPVQILDDQDQRPLGAQPAEHPQHEFEQLRALLPVVESGGGASVAVNSSSGSRRASSRRAGPMIRVQLVDRASSGPASAGPRRAGRAAGPRRRAPTHAPLSTRAPRALAAAASSPTEPRLARAGLATDQRDGRLALERPIERAP